MATLNFPTIPNPDSESWTITYNSQTFTSDLNGAIQTAELPGARWSASLTFTNRTGIEVRRLRGFLAALRGSAGRMYVTPSDATVEGAASANGTVSANVAAGATEIDATGFSAGGDVPLLAGDYFELNGELKIVTQDMSGDTINFAPPLRKDVTSGMTVRIIEPRAVMMLTDDGQASWQVSAPIIYGITFDVVEALDI